MIRLILLPALFFFTTGILHPQIIHFNASPHGFAGNRDTVSWYDPGVSESEKEAILSSKGSRGTLRFGVGRNVGLNRQNSGYIVSNENGSYSWFLFVRSKGAESLNVIFSTYHLSEGETVFIYNPVLTEIIGPLSSKNNKTFGSLAVQPLQGSEMIIEYNFIPGSGGELEVGQLTHDVLGIADLPLLRSLAKDDSGPCQVDINCAEGNNLQKEKRAVVRIIAGGTELGTAFMLNNTKNENIAYTLTANHVVSEQADANNSVFLFNYESPWCDGPEGLKNQTLSGAELVSTNSDIDFTLLRMTDFPPITYKPYLAGWTVSSTFPRSTQTIHHPSGDLKKISIDNDPPGIATFQDLYTNGFWHILRWETGATEGGSSGAPLFNQDRRVVGYLSGGESYCGRSVNDYFGRLDVAYDISQEAGSSLKAWLDPILTGAVYVNGRDPYYDNFKESDTLFNGSADEFYIQEYSDPGRGLSTGINSDSLLAYAEKFTVNSLKYITEVRLFVARSEYTEQSNTVQIALRDDNNGPSGLIAARTFPLNLCRDTFMLSVDFGEPIEVSDDFFVCYLNTYSMPAAEETKQFAFFKGQDQTAGSGSAWFMDYSGWHPFTGHPFDAGEATLFIEALTVNDALVGIDKSYSLPEISVRVYPNPVNSNFWIETAGGPERILSVELFDAGGRLLRTIDGAGRAKILLEGMDEYPDGIYYTRINIDKGSITRKIIKWGN